MRLKERFGDSLDLLTDLHDLYILTDCLGKVSNGLLVCAIMCDPVIYLNKSANIKISNTTN